MGTYHAIIILVFLIIPLCETYVGHQELSFQDVSCGTLDSSYCNLPITIVS